MANGVLIYWDWQTWNLRECSRTCTSPHTTSIPHATIYITIRITLVNVSMSFIIRGITTPLAHVQSLSVVIMVVIMVVQSKCAPQWHHRANQIFPPCARIPLSDSEGGRSWLPCFAYGNLYILHGNKDIL